VLEFPDVSNHEPGLSLSGAPACIAKASEGDWYTDPFYPGFRAQAAALGIPFAAYHWVDTDDLAAQAAHAHAVIGSTPVMWDAEAPGATVPRLLELTDRYRALGGRATLVYLPRWWWRDHLGAPDLTPLYRAGLALISSDYDQAPPDGWAPYGGVSPSIWQFTSTHPFNGQLVDFNRYPGTAQQLGGLFTHGPGGPDMDQQQINWLYNTAQTIWGFSQGLDSVDTVDPDHGNPAIPGAGGGHRPLSLLPFWARVGADVDEDALAAALAGNEQLTTGIATAVLDEEHARLES
jgi:hypothetical protein